MQYVLTAYTVYALLLLLPLLFYVYRERKKVHLVGIWQGEKETRFWFYPKGNKKLLIGNVD